MGSLAIKYQFLNIYKLGGGVVVESKEQIKKIVKKRRKYLVIASLIFMINLILFSYVQQLLESVSSRPITEEIIEIESGSSLGQVTDDLYKNGLIKNPLAFKIYIRIRGLATKIQAGYYQLSSSMSAIEIADTLVKGRVATYKLTLPEGITIEEIGDILAKRGLNKEKFLSLAKNKEVDLFSTPVTVKYNLEGFLFPETYQIPYGADEKEIIDIMVNEFKRRIKPLEEEIKKSEYDLYQIITIASLIQAEAQIKDEAPVIASVIYNRLNRGMKLQLDATVQYSLSERKSRLLYSDLKVDSEYNTYQNIGLPPGPINNPGIEMIKAALKPEDTDYLYYVVTKKGRHTFTKSYREHLEVQRRLK
ncbi:UPF0755 protein [Orenia metallireducens]|uniref:Endolytic murein transglycosylase n=1 Tax=Orenia metallireducens TaxID=1413210 RepID=A0A285I8S7_9FIRM|nr:UPF0755 protein [Orenia metallireducens]SNY44368.1 UPF0755 protein [Orenia metallireducens]